MNKSKLVKSSVLLATGAVVGAVGTPMAAVAAVVYIKPVRNLVKKGVTRFIQHALDPRSHYPYKAR